MSNRLIQMGAAFVIVHTGSLEVNVDAVAAWTQLQVNLTCWHERMHGSGRTLSAFGSVQVLLSECHILMWLCSHCICIYLYRLPAHSPGRMQAHNGKGSLHARRVTAYF